MLFTDVPKSHSRLPKKVQDAFTCGVVIAAYLRDEEDITHIAALNALKDHVRKENFGNAKRIQLAQG